LKSDEIMCKQMKVKTMQNMYHRSQSQWNTLKKARSTLSGDVSAIYD